MCAVGYLIATSSPQGERIVDDLNKELQYEYIEGIIKSPSVGPFLLDWAARNGFSVKDLAMIQPTYSMSFL